MYTPMETIKVGDIVSYKSDYAGHFDYGVVLAVGGYKGICLDVPDAVWCVWRKSKKEAVRVYEELTDEERTKRSSWTGAKHCKVLKAYRDRKTDRMKFIIEGRFC